MVFEVEPYTPLVVSLLMENGFVDGEKKGRTVDQLSGKGCPRVGRVMNL